MSGGAVTIKPFDSLKYLTDEEFAEVHREVLHAKLCSALWFAYCDGFGWPNGLPSWDELRDSKGGGLEPTSFGWWRVTISVMADWAIKVFEAQAIEARKRQDAETGLARKGESAVRKDAP